MTIVLLYLALLTLACKDDGTTQPPTPERVKLTLIDVSVKEAFIHIAVSNPTSNETLSLQRKGTTVMTFAAVADTNITDTALVQTTTYQYTAGLNADNSVTGTSNAISAQTLAPTSHNFTWQTFLLGDGNNSALYDVAIIGDSLIYAVGEIYLGSDPLPYNLVRWNGDSWQLMRVTVQTRFGLITPPLEGILAFSPQDIWVVATDPIHGDGQTWNDYDIRVILQNDGLTVSKGWGSSSARTCFIGRAGNIVTNVNGVWHRLESGTTTSILDAWGVVNPVTGKEEVYCAASSFFEPSAEKKILRITEQTHVDSLPWINRLVTGVWTHASYPIYTSGDGVFENRSGHWREIPTGIYTNDIRGTALNNIIAVGDFGFMIHYNGIEWQTVASDVEAGYATVRLNGSLVCAVGRKGARALVTIGRRN